MGKILSIEERKQLIAWADSFRPNSLIAVKNPVSQTVKNATELPLRNYWSLAQTARNINVPEEIREKASQKLFPVRTRIENWIIQSSLMALGSNQISTSDLLDGKVFGSSLKQGVSFRLPLSSCQPSMNCAGGCYAHDGLDASIASVIRGALNGAFAKWFEQSGQLERDQQINDIYPAIKAAVREALRDANRSSFDREPRIRMAHVGELSAFPCFANAIAKAIYEISNGVIKCVLYTRHKNARLLNQDLFVLNFTLDASSLERYEWAPKSARIVYSAWAGEVRKDVSVNFLEHHFLRHTKKIGDGNVCPATLPDTPERTCDAVKCDLCFKPLRNV